VRPAAEVLGADDDAFLPGRQLERIVLHVLAGAAEDRVQQLLFRAQLGLALGRDLAHQDVAGADPRPEADDAAISSRLRSAFSETFGMSRVNSSRPSFVSRISMSCDSMWMLVNASVLTSRSLIRSRPQSCSRRRS
jgi:hypothetical protein